MNPIQMFMGTDTPEAPDLGDEREVAQVAGIYAAHVVARAGAISPEALAMILGMGGVPKVARDDRMSLAATLLATALAPLQLRPLDRTRPTTSMLAARRMFRAAWWAVPSLQRSPHLAAVLALGTVRQLLPDAEGPALVEAVAGLLRACVETWTASFLDRRIGHIGSVERGALAHVPDAEGVGVYVWSFPHVPPGLLDSPAHTFTFVGERESAPSAETTVALPKDGAGEPERRTLIVGEPDRQLYNSLQWSQAELVCPPTGEMSLVEIGEIIAAWERAVAS